MKCFHFRYLKKAFLTLITSYTRVVYSTYSAKIAWIILIHCGRLGFIWWTLLRISSYVTGILCLRHKNQTVNHVWVNDRYLLWYTKYVKILSGKYAKFLNFKGTEKPCALTGKISMLYQCLTSLVFNIHCYPVLLMNVNSQKCHIKWYCSYVTKARWRM
jgi:hypothetical protein